MISFFIELIDSFPGLPGSLYFHNIFTHFPIVLIFLVALCEFPKSKFLKERDKIFLLGMFNISLLVTFFLGRHTLDISGFAVDQQSWQEENEELFYQIEHHQTMGEILVVFSLIFLGGRWFYRHKSVGKWWPFGGAIAIALLVSIIAHLGAHLRLSAF